MKRQGQMLEAQEARLPSSDRSPAVTRRMLSLGATFLNGSIISNCVKLPFPKGPFMAARTLMLIGQIVFGFETQTVINETTVNEFGRRWFLHLSSPADTEPTRSCCVFLAIVPAVGKLAAWSEKGDVLDVDTIVAHFLDGKLSPKEGWLSGNPGSGWQRRVTTQDQHFILKRYIYIHLLSFLYLSQLLSASFLSHFVRSVPVLPISVLHIILIHILCRNGRNGKMEERTKEIDF